MPGMTDPQHFGIIRERVVQELRERGIPTNPDLPRRGPCLMRQPRKVAERIVQLFTLSGIWEDLHPGKLRDWLIKDGLFDSLEEGEHELFEKGLQDQLTEQELIDLSWMGESMFVLAWSGGIVEEMPFPHEVSSRLVVYGKIPPMVPVPDFIESFRLRPTHEILYQADFHYAIHWAIVQGELNNDRSIEEFVERSTVIERRIALEWLVSHDSWYEFCLDM
jgi:hypothetical protein